MCWDCFPGLDEAEECMVKILCDARRELSLFDGHAMMRHVFSNPVLTALNGSLKKDDLAFSHW